MKKILLILLAIVMCATSLVACVDNAPNQSSTAEVENNNTGANSKTPASSQESSEPEQENFKHEIETEDEFFNSNAYLLLMDIIFENYKESLDNLDTTPDYYIESLSYDPSTQSAVVQVPCVKNGKTQHMTLSLNYTYVGNLKTWVLTNLGYKDTLNRNKVGNDSEFVIKHYPGIQNLAFKFFRAYVQGDKSTAVSLMDSAENPSLEYFSTKKGSMEDEKSFAVEFVSYDYNKADGTGTACVDVRFTRDEQFDYMTLTIATKDEKSADGKITKKCTITNFDFET